MLSPANVPIDIVSAEETCTTTDNWKIGAGEGNRTLDIQLGKLSFCH
jgi:hypothetical protein